MLCLVLLTYIYWRMTELENRLQQHEDNSHEFVTQEDYLESFNNMWNAKLQGQSLAPFAPAE